MKIEQLKNDVRGREYRHWKQWSVEVVDRIEEGFAEDPQVHRLIYSPKHRKLIIKCMPNRSEEHMEKLYDRASAFFWHNRNSELTVRLAVQTHELE